MKRYIFYLTLFLIFSCTNNKVVYWCGDHPCINNKEKEAYFKKTMIVETRNIKKESYKNKSEIEKLLKEARIKEKKRIDNEKELAKEARLEEKRRQKDEKELAKQIRLDEKRRQKDEKELQKRAKLDKTRQIKLEKKMATDKKKEVNKKIVKKAIEEPKKELALETDIDTVKIDLNNFNELVENITKRNKNKPYPSIDNIKN